MKHTISPRQVYELSTRKFLEQCQRRNQRNVIEFRSNGNRKEAHYDSRIGEVATVHGDAGCAEKRLAKTNSDTHLHMKKPNSYEGQAVSPAAPFNPKLFKTGMLVIFDGFLFMWNLYQILRIFL